MVSRPPLSNIVIAVDPSVRPIPCIASTAVSICLKPVRMAEGRSVAKVRWDAWGAV
jgi:hypothetical protein